MSLKNRALILLPGILCTILVSQMAVNAQVQIITSQLTNSDEMNAFVESETFTSQNGVIGIGTIISITNNGTNVPIIPVVTNNPLLDIFSFTVIPAPNDLAETYMVSCTMGSTNITIPIPPFFTVQPQPESVFVGATATFSASVLHTTGYQWQFNGTNLVENGHYLGVTNPVLTISDVTPTDAGTYELIAEQPVLPATNSSAVLSVFKPILLSLAQLSPGTLCLTASNADGSPFESQRVSNISVYTSPNPGLSLSNWALSGSPIVLTNGVLQVDFPASSASNGFFIMVEEP